MRAIQIVLVFSVILAVSNSASAEDNTQKTSGLANRTPLTTSNVRGRPEPPLPFRAEVAFPKINFKNPTVLTNAPGTDRFFVAEQSGKIYSIVGNRSSSKKDLFVDVARLVEQLNGTLDDADKVQGSTTYGLTSIGSSPSPASARPRACSCSGPSTPGASRQTPWCRRFTPRCAAATRRRGSSAPRSGRTTLSGSG